MWRECNLSSSRIVTLREVPQKQRRPVAKPLRYFVDQHNDRKEAMAYAYRTGAYSMQAIADYFCVGRMMVSRAIKRLEIELRNG
ncbi:MAG: hypothetical protein RPU64_06960 [Candidatus Sedimenticola sp. (ex Thyasira tokunagai)]